MTSSVYRHGFEAEETSDGGFAVGVAVQNKYDVPTSFTSKQTIGTTPVNFVIPTGATAFVFEVTHATNTLKVGQGEDVANADINAAADAWDYGIAYGTVPVGLAGASTTVTLIGSAAGTTVNMRFL